ncbi:putative glycoside hydrolase [Rosellinia necatrix]|uniref:Putative glycoside hydrolase n=1 Tax=Rosellinia necatrix TaxID=77044 RepID=A0A1W2THA8_ROSNE|nr:putative glycoside hydrolase [Rosellinia necatrix]
MEFGVLAGILAMARLAAGAAYTVPAVYDPSATHTLQFNLDLVEQEFKLAGYHSTFEADSFSVLAAIDDYTGPARYGNKAINAPINCLGQNTHLGCFAWLDGVFHPNRCADACTAKTQYDVTHGLPDRPCRFFNTYILKKNGEDFAQYCSLVNALASIVSE